MTVSINPLICFLLVLGRVSGLFAMAPALSDANVNGKAKIGLALCVALMISLALPPSARPSAEGTTMYSIVFAVAGEFSIGLLIAAGFRLALSSAAIAGELVGLQMGLGAAAMYDPSANTNTGLAITFFEHLYVVLFLMINGHHDMLRALSASFETTAPGQTLALPSLPLMIRQIAEMTALGCRMAAPVVILLVAISIGVGLLSRVDGVGRWRERNWPTDGRRR